MANFLDVFSFELGGLDWTGLEWSGLWQCLKITNLAKERCNDLSRTAWTF